MAQHSPELNELAAALSAAQAEFVAIPKTDTNPFFKSKYAGLPQVVAVASPILTKHGLSVSQHIGHDDGGDTLTTWLLHKSGQFISESMRLHSAPQKGLTEVQAQGSATTYSRRYAYMAVLGLVADEDDDGNTAQPQPRQQRASNGNSAPSAPKLATIDDIRQMKSAATALAPDDVKMVMAACGLAGVDGYNKVPHDKVADVVARLNKVER